MLKEASIQSDQGTIHYRYTANGKDTRLLVFHGYGQDSKKMQAIAELAQNHDIFLFDLPAHGKTSTPDIRPKEWCEAIAKVTGEKVSIFAYSLGGSVALSMLGVWPGKIEQVILAAPSGIGNDAIYDIAVHTVLGRKLFAAFVKYPWFVMTPIRFAKALKMIPFSLGVFLLSKIDTKEKRVHLFNKWMQCRYLRIPPGEAIANIRKGETKISIIAGKQDTFVTPGQVRKFAKKIPHAVYLEVDAGHRLYEEAAMKKICEMLSL